MNGRILMIALIASALSIGGGIWYSAEVASYESVTDIDQVRVGETSWSVTNYQGIDGASSPLKLRGCFDFELPYSYDPTHSEDATPLIAPRWFDCFDAEQIQADIVQGVASVLISTENEPFGFTTYIAHYPDQRGYIWRQINACGAAQFSGEALPEECGGAVPDDALRALALAGDYVSVMPADGSVRGTGAFACFQTELSLALVSETFVIAETAPPNLVGAPACFPADIGADITEGLALLLKGEDQNQLIALYPDGRGYAWVTE